MSRSTRRVSRCGVAVALMVALVVPLGAQDRPVVLVHGLQSSGAAWGATASRLRADLAADVRTPDLAWTEPYLNQAVGLNQRWDYASLPGNTIAVGHSNGGIVARQWSTIRPLGGVITFGTPHGGAPLIPQFYNWQVFQGSAPYFINNVASAFSRVSDWSWAFAYVSGALSWTADFSLWSVIYLGASLGLDRALPVASDMRPGSAALNALNSPANIDRERAALPARVGIVSAAHNFYWAGPARGVIPDQADAVATALYGSAAALLGWATQIFLSADHMDLDAVDQSSSLFSLASFLLSIDPLYCTLVSSIYVNECVANDGVVPYTSQVYPGAPNLYLGFEHNDGPAHTQEMQQHDVIEDVLVRFFAVPARGSVPPPPTPPAPPPSEPGPGQPPTDPDPGHHPPPASGPGLMASDQWLVAGESVRSENGLYELVYQGDGNLVLYNAWGTPLWASGTAGIPPGFVAMQGDGNFVIYDDTGTAVWSSDDSLGHPGAYLFVQNDGNVVIYDVDGTPLWATNTVQ